MTTFDFAEADRQIRAIAKIEGGRNVRNMTMGWFSARMKLADAWQANGYADEAAYRDAVGVSNGVWSRYCRIAGCLPKMDLAEFTAMSAENAEQLGRLPEEMKYAEGWTADAWTMDAEQFRKCVMKALAEVQGIPVGDMRVKFSIPLFEAQRTVIKNGIAEFQKEHGLKDEGTALEWMVMEVSGRQTFAKFLQQQIPVLRQAWLHNNGAGSRKALEDHALAMVEMLDKMKGKQ
jgi:hypothetical protein